MSPKSVPELEIRQYYNETLSGDGVCTVTEDEYVAEYFHSKHQGKQIALKAFKGLPSSVDMDRSFIICDAQKLVQKTYQPVIIADSG